MNPSSANFSIQRPLGNTVRPTRPPVPLFHSNSTGDISNFANVQSQQQSQQVTDFANLIMGGGGNSPSFDLFINTPLTLVSEINVAYSGTFDDLSAAGGAPLFNMSDNFDFDQLINSTVNDFQAVNSSATVSPKDVFATGNDSMPPSTAFTNLTTPGSAYLDTPDDDYQTSPLFSDNIGFDSQGANDNWFPLFGDADASAVTAGALSTAPSMTRTVSTSSASQIVVHPGGESISRKRSSAHASPATFASPALKPSSVAGVNARKRDKPLPPIVVDEADSVALKRARNTAAARKSRAKKVEERDTFLAEIADLQSQIEYWKNLALGNAKESIEK